MNRSSTPIEAREAIDDLAGNAGTCGCHAFIGAAELSLRLRVGTSATFRILAAEQ
jgi:hypothetical protein